MCRFAEQRNAMAPERIGCEAREGKYSPRADLADGAEQALQASLQNIPKCSVVERGKALGLRRSFNPHKARGGAGIGTVVSGPAGLWNSVEISR